MLVFLSLFFCVLVTGVFVLFLWVIIKYLSFKVNSFFDKLTPYECGFDPLGMGRSNVSLGFFVICIIFLLFSVEVIMLFPIVHFMKFSYESYEVHLVVFLFLLLFGLIYEWNKGALEWFN